MFILPSRLAHGERPSAWKRQHGLAFVYRNLAAVG